jgi:hypothetical protein
MKNVLLSVLLNLSLLFAPTVLSAADTKPKSPESNQPQSGAKTQQDTPIDHSSIELKDSTDQADSDKPDSDVAGVDQPGRPKIEARPTSMHIITERAGLKTLTIHFRWSLFPNASIEVRLVPGPQAKGANVAPIYFAEQLKGDVRRALFTCLDHPGEGGRSHSFTKDKTVYDMIGRRNSLGNQGVYVLVHPEESEAPGASPAAAYLQLDTWAVDKEVLSLDLPRNPFAKPGTLFVWFFRGDRVVWAERIRWPGY